MRSLITITYKKKYTLNGNLRHFPNNLHPELNFIKAIFHLSMIYYFLVHIALLICHCSLYAPHSYYMTQSSCFLYYW